MKAEAEIHTRLRELLVAEFDRRVELAQARLPRLCTHNHQQPLDNRKTVDGDPNPLYNRVTSGRRLPVVQTIGLCMLWAETPDQWQGTICEDPIDAQRCPMFTPVNTKETILEEYRADLSDSGWIQANLPEVATLMWALDQEQVQTSLPLLKRLWFWIRRIKPVPRRDGSVDLANLGKLLPAAEERDADLGA